MSRPKRILFLTDIHLPYHICLTPVWQFAHDFKPDIVVLGGDLHDYEVVSTWVSDQSRHIDGNTVRDCFKELKRDVISPLREAIGKSPPMIYLEGNHELWLTKAIAANPNGRGYWEVENNLDFDKLNMEWYPINVPYAASPHLYYIHGIYVNEYHAKKTVQAYQKSVLYGHCFDETTELLTEDGFVTQDQLCVGLPVATLNLQNGKCEYSPIRNIHRYDHYRELVGVNGRNVDLFVTPEHGLIDFSNPVPALYSAQDATKNVIRTFRCAIPSNRLDLPVSDDELRLIVWISADGHLENSRAISWHLKKIRKIAALKALLKRMSIPTTLSQHKIRISIPDGTVRDAFSWTRKILPSWLRFASDRQAIIILEEYAITDGCNTGPNTIQIATSKKEEADCLQQLFVTSNLRCNMITHHDGYVLSINVAHPESELRSRKNFSTAAYTGMVWCVTVDPATLMVRRNGKVCVTQNTHDVQEYTVISPINVSHVTKGKSVGCLCTLNPSYNKNRPNKWVNGFNFAYIWDNGYFSEYQVNIIDGRFIANGVMYPK